MHEGGVSMPHGSVVGPSSFTEDNGKTDTDHTVSIIILLLCKFRSAELSFVEISGDSFSQLKNINLNSYKKIL